jgi:branched-chain amino acid aminotransferase
MVTCADKIWIDGELRTDDDASQVSLLTHTLHYGVGAFEGVRAYKRASGESAIFRLHEHVRRLFDSCKLVLMTPTVTPDQVARGCVDVLAKSSMPDGYIRPICYLGAGSMGLLPRDNDVVTAITAWSWGAYLGGDALDVGIRCKISSLSRHHVNVAYTRGKIIGQYVSSVMAKRDAQLSGFDEAILLDTRGYVAEGSGENIFAVRDGELITPPLAAAILPGITRDTVMVLAREAGLTVREELFTRDELFLADEVFFTGTAAEITPIREIDHRPVGDGKVGPMTRRLQERYFDIVRGRDTTHPEWLTLYAVE